MRLYATIMIDLDETYTDVDSAKEVVTQTFYECLEGQAQHGMEFSLCDYTDED